MLCIYYYIYNKVDVMYRLLYSNNRNYYSDNIASAARGWRNMVGDLVDVAWLDKTYRWASIY